VPGHLRLLKCVLATVIGASLGAGPLGFVAPVPALAGSLPDRVCSFAWWRGDREVKDVIRCAAHRWEVKGGARKALHVADCESGFDPDARGNGFAGVYQHLKTAWPDRAATFGFKGASVFNGRANSIVAVRMAHEGGWGAWSGCL
jgi:hypothetical protein